MKKELPFPYPFSGFGDLNFINCFTCFYLYANGISDAVKDDCALKLGGRCDGCGGCNNNNLISGMYWFFETIVGYTSTRFPLDGDINFDTVKSRNHPDTVDFLLQFTGLDYTIEKDDMPAKAIKSIDNGWPLFARMKISGPHEFLVITGYDDTTNEIITAAPGNVNDPPTISLTWDDITEIIVIREKVKPKVGLADAFRRIATVIENNVKSGSVWDTCIQGFNFWGGINVGIDELERRFKRMHDAAFYNFNSHFFAEQFRNPVYEPLKDPRLEDIRRRIDRYCDVAHMRNWQMVALYEFRGDWSKMNDNVKEWGYATSMLDCIKVLKSCDIDIMEAINDAIRILES